MVKRNENNMDDTRDINFFDETHFCVSDDCLPLGVKIFDTRLFWARGVTPDGVYGDDLARVDGVLGLNIFISVSKTYGAARDGPILLRRTKKHSDFR